MDTFPEEILTYLLVENIHSLRDIINICKLSKAWIKFKKAPWRIDYVSSPGKIGVILDTIFDVYANIQEIREPYLFMTSSPSINDYLTHPVKINPLLEDNSSLDPLVKDNPLTSYLKINPSIKQVKIIGVKLYKEHTLKCLMSLLPAAKDIKIYSIWDTSHGSTLNKYDQQSVEENVLKESELTDTIIRDIEGKNFRLAFGRKLTKEGTEISSDGNEFAQEKMLLIYPGHPVCSLSFSMLKEHGKRESYVSTANHLRNIGTITTITHSYNKNMFHRYMSEKASNTNHYSIDLVSLSLLLSDIEDLKVTENKDFPEAVRDRPFLRSFRNFVIEGPLYGNLSRGMFSQCTDYVTTIIDIMLRHGDPRDIKRLDFLFEIDYAIQLWERGIELDKYYLVFQDFSQRQMDWIALVYRPGRLDFAGLKD